MGNPTRRRLTSSSIVVILANMTSGPPPAQLLLGMMRGFVVTKALYSAAALGVADHMTTDNPREVDELAVACHCEPRALERLLRALCSSGVFGEPAAGRFVLTDVGSLLRSDPPSMRSWVLLNGGLVYQVFEEALGTFQTGRAASQQALGQDFFGYLDAHPEAGRIFDHAMQDMTTGSAQLILDSCNLSDVRSAVDVGGGDGTLLMGLLDAMPTMSGVVVDKEEVVSRARERAEVADFGDRLEFRPGDFFETLPSGAELYLLGWILHDWDDEASGRILRACRQAMTARSRLLILESVLPAGDQPHFSRYGDLVMMVLFNGRERTRGEFSDLLEMQGLRLTMVHQSTPPRSVLEVRRAAS
jgi:hypothetical protein